MIVEIKIINNNSKNDEKLLRIEMTTYMYLIIIIFYVND